MGLPLARRPASPPPPPARAFQRLDPWARPRAQTARAWAHPLRPAPSRGGGWTPPLAQGGQGVGTPPAWRPAWRRRSRVGWRRSIRAVPALGSSLRWTPRSLLRFSAHAGRRRGSPSHTARPRSDRSRLPAPPARHGLPIRGPPFRAGGGLPGTRLSPDGCHGGRVPAGLPGARRAASRSSRASASPSRARWCSPQRRPAAGRGARPGQPGHPGQASGHQPPHREPSRREAVALVLPSPSLRQGGGPPAPELRAGPFPRQAVQPWSRPYLRETASQGVGNVKTYSVPFWV